MTTRFMRRPAVIPGGRPRRRGAGVDGIFSIHRQLARKALTEIREERRATPWGGRGEVAKWAETGSFLVTEGLKVGEVPPQECWVLLTFPEQRPGLTGTVGSAFRGAGLKPRSNRA